MAELRSTPGETAGTSTRMLALATVGFLVNFWAWALISPLGSAYREELGLSAIQQALLVAVPVIVGSIGRIPAGALTDRLGNDPDTELRVAAEEHRRITRLRIERLLER